MEKPIFWKLTRSIWVHFFGSSQISELIQTISRRETFQKHENSALLYLCVFLKGGCNRLSLPEGSVICTLCIHPAEGSKCTLDGSLVLLSTCAALRERTLVSSGGGPAQDRVAIQIMHSH